MKRLALLFVLLSILCGVQSVSAAHKSDRLKPKWMHTLPESLSDTYFFVVAHGTGTSLDAARQASFIHLSRKLEDEHGLVVNTHLTQHTHNETTTHGSKGSRVTDITITAEEQGREINIGCRIIDEYWDGKDSDYEIYVLYAVSRGLRGGSYDDNITVTSRYPGAGFLSIVPSAGQFYKGDNLKGGLILAGQVASLGGVLICEETRASYVKKMYEQPQFATEYNSLASKWESGRNICIGVACAVYVYNLIDAFATKGAKRVVVKPARPMYVSLLPYADGHSCGANLSINF